MALRTHLTAGVPLSSTTDTPLSAPPPPNTLRSSPHFSCEQLRTAAQVQREQAGRAAGQIGCLRPARLDDRGSRVAHWRIDSAATSPRARKAGRVSLAARRTWANESSGATVPRRSPRLRTRSSGRGDGVRVTAPAVQRQPAVGHQRGARLRPRSVRCKQGRTGLCDPPRSPGAAPGGRPNNCTPHVGGWAMRFAWMQKRRRSRQRGVGSIPTGDPN